MKKILFIIPLIFFIFPVIAKIDEDSLTAQMEFYVAESQLIEYHLLKFLSHTKEMKIEDRARYENEIWFQRGRFTAFNDSIQMLKDPIQMQRIEVPQKK